MKLKAAAATLLGLVVLTGTVACASTSSAPQQAPLTATPQSPSPTPTVMTSQDALVRERILKARESAPRVDYGGDSPCMIWGSAPPGTSEERLKWVREHSSGCLPGNTDSRKWKPNDFGVPACRGGEGPYVAIFSDGSSIDVYGLTCQEAKAQAKRLAPDGTEIVDFFPI